MNSSHVEDWTQKIHMTTWFCDFGHTPPLEFNDEHAFREHLKAQHEEVNKWQANALVRRKRGLGCRDQTICPLCECVPENIPNKMNHQDKLSMLFSHIGNHLRSLAFFSLPSLDGGEANDTDESSIGANIMSGDSNEKDTSRGSDNQSGNDGATIEIPLVFDGDDPKAQSRDSVLLPTEHPEGVADVPDTDDPEWDQVTDKFHKAREGNAPYPLLSVETNLTTSQAIQKGDSLGLQVLYEPSDHEEDEKTTWFGKLNCIRLYMSS